MNSAQRSHFSVPTTIKKTRAKEEHYKISSEMKAYRVQGDRATQELIRKRRHNLFKRLTEFNDRYQIDIWLTMRMPSGRIYDFATKPDEPIPSEEEIQARQVPVIHKTPADYTAKRDTAPLLEAPPSLPFLELPISKISTIPDTEYKGTEAVGLNQPFGALRQDDVGLERESLNPATVAS